MKVTVKDCLQLDSFRKCVLVAGERNLGNRVKAVSVMDSKSSSEALKCSGNSGTMVLTSFAGMRDDIAIQCQTVKALGEAGVAAIVIFQREKVSKTIDKKVVRAAEDVSVPLMVLVDGEEVDYSNIISQVMENVLYGNNFKNSLINNTIFHLLNFEKYTSFQEALKEAAIRNDFQIVILDSEFNPFFSVETRYQATVSECVRRGKEAAINLSTTYNLIEIDGILTYWGFMHISDEKCYLCIVDNEDNYSTGEMSKLAEIIELAAGMWKYTPERDAKVELIKALLRGNKSLAYSIRQEAGVENADVLSVFQAQGINNAKGDELIKAYVDKGTLRKIIFVEEDICYGILLKGLNSETIDEDERKQACICLYNSLKAIEGARIFHITGIDGIEGAGDGFRLIGETCVFAGAVFPNKRIISKYELTLVSNCIKIQMDGGQLKKNFLGLLAPFEKIGDNKARQLLDTLETFVLDAGLNSNKTAELMGIHTNTVQYRLKKINECLGVEITGNRIAPGLTISLALRRMEKTTR